MAPTYDWPWVETQVSRISQTWRECSGLSLPCASQISLREQRRRESIYDRAVLAVERETTKKLGAVDRAGLQNRLIKVFGEFAATALDLPDDAIELITSDFVSLGAEFARQARRFDPDLPMNDIFQACRNAWTAGGLQSLLGGQPAVTPSILGYSLLYPYSDNFIDNKRVSGREKAGFSARFRSRLRGEALAPHNSREASIWDSVGLIESQYPHASYPQVYDCLLAIHRAQEQSIAQLRKPSCAAEEELLAISFAKGGASVLADACLVTGRLCECDAGLAFDWGAVLQLGDDLQDVREDLRRGAQTLFTRAVHLHQPLDCLAAQLLNFSEQTAVRMNGFPHGSATLKDLLRTSWRSIVLAAIASATEFFSTAFLDEVESSSPFRFQFLQSRNQKLARRNGVYAKLFTAILEEPEARSNSAPVRACALNPSTPGL